MAAWNNSSYFGTCCILKTALGIVFLERNVDFSANVCWLRDSESHSTNNTLLEKVGGATAAIRRTLFDAQNRAAVDQYNTLTAVIWEMWPRWASHLVFVPEDRSTACRTSSPTSVLLRRCGLPAFVRLGGIRPVSRRRRPRDTDACDLDAVVADTFQCTDVQRLHCYFLILLIVISCVSVRLMHTPHCATFFGT
jgi:hypothetical protein